MKRFATLARLFVIRTMREERFLTLLSVVGVALGIGLFVGVKLASDKAVASLESGVRGISAAATHEIYDPSGVDFDESVYRDLALTEPSSLPVLSTAGTFGTQRESIHIMGVYTLKALKFLGIAGGSSRDLERILTIPDGVAVSKGFAERNSLGLGDSLTLSLYDGNYTVSVAAAVDTDRWPPNTIIMDLGNYQELFNKVGYLTKIDVTTDDRSAEVLSTAIPTHLVIEKKEDIIRNKKALIASFKYNLQFISLIAILVGMFLLYNTIFISVVKRRTEIGIIRALGASKRTVISLFTFQGLILGAAGSVLGIALGQVTAYLSVNAVKKTVSTMFTVVSVSDYLLGTNDALIALALGIVVSLIASALPAIEAARIRPQESAREGSFEGRYKGYLGYLLLLGIFLGLAGCGLSLYEYHKMPFSFPLLSYVGILLIILGFTFSAPLFLVSVLRLAQRPLVVIFKAAGRITVGDMRGSVYRFSIALMSVAVSTALIVALLTLIFSFRGSLIGWIERTIAADVYIKPASCGSNYCFQALSPEVIKMVSGLPEVDDIDRYRALQVELRGRRVIAGFGTTAVTRRFGAGRYFDRLDDERMKALENNKEVAISHYLATRYGLKPGDDIDIQTPSGTQRFTVNDTFMSYSTTSGFVYLDRKWLRTYWGLDDATQVSVYLKEGRDVASFIRRLKGLLPPHYSLEIMNNQELRQKILDIFDGSFAITYAIELIAIFVSVIGVVNTLVALVLERKRETSVVRYLGGSWRQVQGIIVLSAAIAGFAGIALGLLMGPMMSMIFMHVVNKVSFGWEVSLTMPTSYLVLVASVLCMITALAGLLPARIARRIDPKRFISYE